MSKLTIDDFVVLGRTVPEDSKKFGKKVCMSAALWGTLPHAEKVALNDPDQVRRFKEMVITYRDRWLWNACGALWLGLFVGCLGALLKAVNLA